MKLIMFDFDGVIVESAQLAFEISKRLHNGDLTLQQWRDMSNGNVFDDPSVQKLTNNDIPLEQNPFFLEHGPGIMKMGPAAGMAELIRDFAKRAKLAVVSSGATPSMERFFQAFELRDHIKEILGGDIEPKKTLKIERLLKTHNASTDEALFVTDTLGDIREATHVGVQSIGVTWGVHPRETLSLGEPHSIVESPDELSDMINHLWKHE